MTPKTIWSIFGSESACHMTFSGDAVDLKVWCIVMNCSIQHYSLHVHTSIHNDIVSTTYICKQPQVSALAARDMHGTAYNGNAVRTLKAFKTLLSYFYFKLSCTYRGLHYALINCHMTCILGVGNDFNIFDVKNDSFIFDPKNACHLTFLCITVILNE